MPIAVPEVIPHVFSEAREDVISRQGGAEEGVIEVDAGVENAHGQRCLRRALRTLSEI
jgi:hypothetical protein